MISKKLNENSRNIVYLAKVVPSGKPCVIKFLSHEEGEPSDAYHMEMRVKEINHPNIIKIIDS